MEVIDYATRERQHGWLRRSRRRIVVVAMYAALGIGAYQVQKPVVRYGLWHYWHWQVSRCQMPADAAERLIGEKAEAFAKRPNGDYVYTAGNVRRPPSAEFSPLPVRRLAEIDPSFAGRFDAFRRSTFRVAYIGQHVRPDGARRTVIVRGIDEWFSPVDDRTAVVVANPGWLDGPPRGLTAPILLRMNCEEAPAGETKIVSHESEAGAVVMTSTGTIGGVSMRLRIVGRLTNDDQIAWSLAEYIGPPVLRPRLPAESAVADGKTAEAESTQRLIERPTLAAKPRSE